VTPGIMIRVTSLGHGGPPHGGLLTVTVTADDSHGPESDPWHGRCGLTLRLSDSESAGLRLGRGVLPSESDAATATDAVMSPSESRRRSPGRHWH
jgi:hypothetical protein